MFDPRKALILAAALLIVPAGAAFAQSPQAFHLGPSDEIEISVWLEPNLSSTVIVRPDGLISLPLIGSVEVAGKTPEEVEIELQERFRAFLSDPIVVVIVRGFNNSQVSVLGEVRSPGRYSLQQPLSILDAIATAGGFSDYADIDNVIVLRPDETGIQRMRVNIKDILEKANEELLMLLPGDIVYVK